MNKLPQCPSHRSLVVVPTDSECHDHQGDLQQFAHNLHCKGLKCPLAKPGFQRNDLGPCFGPRTFVEKVLSWADRLYDTVSR